MAIAIDQEVSSASSGLAMQAIRTFVVTGANRAIELEVSGAYCRGVWLCLESDGHPNELW